MFIKGIDTCQCLFPCVCQHGTKPGSSTIPGHKLADFFQILCRCRIHIHSHCSMGMDIDKSGNHMASGCVVDLGVSARLKVFWKNKYMPILHGDRPVTEPTIHIDAAAFNIIFLHSLVLLILEDLPQILSYGY